MNFTSEVIDVQVLVWILLTIFLLVVSKIKTKSPIIAEMYYTAGVCFATLQIELSYFSYENRILTSGDTIYETMHLFCRRIVSKILFIKTAIRLTILVATYNEEEPSNPKEGKEMENYLPLLPLENSVYYKLKQTDIVQPPLSWLTYLCFLFALVNAKIQPSSLVANLIALFASLLTVAFVGYMKRVQQVLDGLTHQFVLLFTLQIVFWLYHVTL